MARQTNSDREFLRVARDRWAAATDAWNQQEQRERDDLSFYQGEGQWPKDILAARGVKGGSDPTSNSVGPVPARPTLTINNLRAPVRQILNQESQADMGIELVAADDFGGDTPPVTEAEIELREGLVRRIQRQSDANDARRWAFSRATIAGTGYYRVLTAYLPGKTFDQDVIIQRIYNQNLVKLDPAHEQPDGSDCEWEFISTILPVAQFKAEFPDARVPDTNADDFFALKDQADDWYLTEGGRDIQLVRVTEYYYTERTPRTLVDLGEQGTAWLDEMGDEPPDPKVAPRRTVIQKSIKWAKLTGLEILEETDWPSPYMPIIKVTGEEMHPWDEQRRSEGIVRPARDAAQGFNYMVSKFVETVGLTPIPPLMMAAGQDEGYESEYRLSSVRTIPVLHYNQKDNMQQPAPPPFRTPAETQIQPMSMGIQMFATSIQNTTSVPDPALGNIDPALKSGKAVSALIDQSQRGTSGFLENLRRSIEYEAKVVNSLLPVICGRPGRIARMIGANGDPKTVAIGGQPAQPQPGGQGQAPQPTQGPERVPALTNDVNFNVAIKITKAYDTQRQQFAAQLSEIIQADPQLMTVFGDLLFRLQDGPGHNELADRMKLMLDPRVQSALSGQTPLPPAVQQQMEQGKQMIQGLSQKVQELTQVIASKQVEAQAKLQEAKMDNDTKVQIAYINASAQLSATDAKLNAENARTYVEAIEKRGAQELGAKMDLTHKALDQVHERLGQTLDHAHERLMQATDQRHEAVQGQQQAQVQQDLASEQQQHEQDQAAQAQQAAPDATQE